MRVCVRAQVERRGCMIQTDDFAAPPRTCDIINTPGHHDNIDKINITPYPLLLRMGDMSYAFRA
jgi:hypothetical protein